MYIVLELWQKNYIEAYNCTISTVDLVWSARPNFINRMQQEVGSSRTDYISMTLNESLIPTSQIYFKLVLLYIPRFKIWLTVIQQSKCHNNYSNSNSYRMAQISTRTFGLNDS